MVNNPQSKRTFEKLETGKGQIEAELGGQVEWSSPAEEGERGKVVRVLSGNVQDRNHWNDYFAWLKDQAETFYSVFYPRTHELRQNDEETE